MKGLKSKIVFYSVPFNFMKNLFSSTKLNTASARKNNLAQVLRKTRRAVELVSAVIFTVIGPLRS